MALIGTLLGDLILKGKLTVEDFAVGGAFINDAQIESDAAIDPTKIVQFMVKNYAQNSNVATVVERKGIHIARIAGTLNDIKFSMKEVPGATSTVTFDCLKNGSSILSASITFTSADTAFVSKSGVFTASPYVADVDFEISITVSGSNLGKGPMAQLTVIEATQ